MRRSVEQRFWEKVGDHSDPTKCWLWTASTIKSGTLRYGHFWVYDKMMLSHRLSYEMYHHSTIPEGMTIDHVKVRGCTSTLCVNPHHLEAVIHKGNVLRGVGVAAINAKVTHCPQGHPYNKDNTCVSGGKRYCLVCQRERRLDAKTKTLRLTDDK